ncbi:MAG: SpoIID/LytB domain-containing protein [Actinomycetota bacterium]|nr:SpoIID/LytB domain-containing protein [Actinomycetota bacterium]
MRRPAIALAVVLVAGVLTMGQPAFGHTTVTITGGGYGHGMGMSQYGAYGRALAGKSDTGILTHYYTGVHVRTASFPHRIRVGLLQGQSSVSLSSVAITPDGGRVVFKVGHHRIARGGPSVAWRVEPSATGGMRLYKDDVKVTRKGKSVFGNTTRPLRFLYRRFKSLAHIADKNLNYRYGRMQFETYASASCGAGFCVRLVLSVSMQQYLYGLGEVPSSWPRAALESQAIAGRTYAYQKAVTSGQHRYPCDCTVYDSTLDQAYVGDAKRTQSGPYWKDWKGAVDSTKAQVLLYDSHPIEALYMSSSGGYTENNNNVWGGAPIPYLRGVPDRPDAVSANPNHSWVVKMTWKEFQSKLNASFNIGTLQRFKLVKPFGVSGRVTVVKPNGTGGVRIAGSNGVYRASGWEIRSVLGLKDTLFRVRVTYGVGRVFLSTYRNLKKAPGRTTGKPYRVPRRAKNPLGKAQNFRHGRLTWNAALDKVVWQWGPILRHYDDMGRERSSLGMPTSGIWGRKSYKGASYRRGRIYWSKGTGAYVVRGDFLTAYRAYGGPPGPLSLPIGHRESSTKLPNGGRRQRFATGTLYLNPMRSTVFALWGLVDERYHKLGLATSSCGYPTSSMTPHNNGFVVTFQHGKITLSGKGIVRVSCG